MRVGILGAGFMGGTHARAFAKLPDVQIVAISSRQPEQAAALAREVGARAVADDRAILDDPTLDAISITVPTPLHPMYTIAALEAGKHVLTEKPLALTADACRPILDAHARTGRILMVAHVLRFWPEYVVLVDLVQSGALGRPLAATAIRLSPPPGWADWFTDPAISGGAVLDMCIHDFDALNWLLGTPHSILARGQQAKPGLWNQVQALVDFGAVSGSVEGSQMMPKAYPFSAALRVVCENGVVEYTLRAGGTRVDAPGIRSLAVYTNERSFTPEVPPGDAYERQIAYFVECVRTGRQPQQGTPEQARLAVRCANAARESLESGAVVRV